MNKNTTYVVGLVVVIALGVAAYLLWPVAPVPQTLGVATTTPQLRTYTAPGSEFSIRYPAGFTVESNEKGVLLHIPAALATDTNLSTDSYLSVERGPDKATCTAADFLESPVSEQMVTDAGVTYAYGTVQGAAAGNRYEEIVYVLPDCYAIRYFIHSTVVENYPEGTSRTFDRDGLIGIFDDIRRSLQMQVKG
ncbi:MAG: hypothetical protein AAB955_03980 [Patescibacteria group bacterium]